MLKLTSFPPEILEKLIPDFNPKTITELKLVCTKFNTIFSHDQFYKHYLQYSEEDFLANIKCGPLVEDVQKIVEGINSGKFGKYNGLWQVQKAHYNNLISGRFDLYQVINVSSEHFHLTDYVHSKDLEYGHWMGFLFEGARVTLFNLNTKQQLHHNSPECSGIHFSNGFLILEFGQIAFSVYKLIENPDESERFTLESQCIENIDSLLAQVGKENLQFSNVKISIGTSPNVLITTLIYSATGIEQLIMVFNVELKKVSHSASLEFKRKWLGKALSECQVLMKSHELIHLVSCCRVATFRLMPKQLNGFVQLDLVSWFWMTNMPRDPLTGYIGRIMQCFVDANCLMWQNGKSVHIIKFKGVEFEEEALSFEVPTKTYVVGFVKPDIVLTRSKPPPRRSGSAAPLAIDQGVKAHKLDGHRLGPPLFDLPIETLFEHPLTFIPFQSLASKIVICDVISEYSYRFKLLNF